MSSSSPIVRFKRDSPKVVRATKVRQDNDTERAMIEVWGEVFEPVRFKKSVITGPDSDDREALVQHSSGNWIKAIWNPKGASIGPIDGVAEFITELPNQEEMQQRLEEADDFEPYKKHLYPKLVSLAGHQIAANDFTKLFIGVVEKFLEEANPDDITLSIISEGDRFKKIISALINNLWTKTIVLKQWEKIHIHLLD